MNEKPIERQINEKLFERPVEKPFEKELDKQFTTFNTMPQNEEDKLGKFLTKTKINDSFRQI